MIKTLGGLSVSRQRFDSAVKKITDLERELSNASSREVRVVILPTIGKKETENRIVKSIMIIHEVLSFLEVNPSFFYSGIRSRRYSDMRHMIATILSESVPELRREELADIFLRTHGSITNNIARHRELYRTNKRYKETYDSIIKHMISLHTCEELGSKCQPEITGHDTCSAGVVELKKCKNCGKESQSIIR